MHCVRAGLEKHFSKLLINRWMKSCWAVAGGNLHPMRHAIVGALKLFETEIYNLLYSPEMSQAYLKQNLYVNVPWSRNKESLSEGPVLIFSSIAWVFIGTISNRQIPLFVPLWEVIKHLNNCTFVSLNSFLCFAFIIISTRKNHMEYSRWSFQWYIDEWKLLST